MGKRNEENHLAISKSLQKMSNFACYGALIGFFGLKIFLQQNHEQA